MKRSKTPQSKRFLTERENEVLEFIISGMSNSLIADELALSVKTIETHKHNILLKLGAASTADLIRRYPVKRKKQRTQKKRR